MRIFVIGTVVSAALVFAVVGGVLTALLAARHGEPRDMPAAGFAGGCAGVLASTLMVATCRAVEPMLGTRLGASPAAAGLLWAALGTGLAATSLWLVPPRVGPEGST
jgi:hypothetical protein